MMQEVTLEKYTLLQREPIALGFTLGSEAIFLSFVIPPLLNLHTSLQLTQKQQVIEISVVNWCVVHVIMSLTISVSISAHGKC